MELIQIDSVKQSFIETRFYQYDQTLRWDDILLLDTETGEERKRTITQV